MGLDQPHRSNPSCLCLVPFNSFQRQGNDLAEGGPRALMCYVISGFELQDLTGFLDVVSPTPGEFSWGLCSSRAALGSFGACFPSDSSTAEPEGCKTNRGEKGARKGFQQHENQREMPELCYLRSVSVTLHFPRSSDDKAALPR